MSQLDIFDILDGNPKVFFKYGAMYARVIDGIQPVPVELGDGTLYPGEFVSKLGDKKRTSFEMGKGYYLRYCGMVDSLLLFSVNEFVSDFYYAFHYIDRNTLVVGSHKGVRDIRISRLKKLPGL
ncbi:hypothetical protein WD019_03050 [Fictibacillus sp. Mic-4]|uniref:hypothetical protein n=1 Tax=Fictibacillus sp. Mic-4 TaxID=3132826 RepID=UPI003CEF8AF6